MAVLAEWMRRATEQLAKHSGPAIGGLLLVSFGSVAELMLAFFVLASGETEVVQAQVTGSIIATSLFGLGLAIFVGGLKRKKQVFNPAHAGLLSTLLILAVVALSLPAVFDYTGRLRAHVQDMRITDESFSLGAAVVLILLYGGNLVYTMFTHQSTFADGESKGHASWSIGVAAALMVVTTGLIALEAEAISRTLTETGEAAGLPPTFLGVIVLALVGTSADLFAACWFSYEGKISLALEICIGSSIQIALVVAPLLVLVSAVIWQPMTLVFHNPMYLFAIASTAFVVNAVARDGETNWFEGMLLIGVYVLFALGFFYVAP